MHQYLRAIGFGSALAGEHDLELLLDNLYHTFDEREVARSGDNDRTFLEMKKAFGPSMGICVCGEMDSHGFYRTGYFPYLRGSGVSTQAEVSVEPKGSGNGFNALVEDDRVGVSLIFSLQNPIRFLKNSMYGTRSHRIKGVTLSGLSLSGKILLPVGRPGGTGRPMAEEKLPLENFYKKHDALVRAAREGDQAAIESLTIEDMDTYAMISRRLVKEDLYSIVETSFMPSGMESDQYQILGKIEFYTRVQNPLTDEYVYQMTVSCNGLTFDICIHDKDLLGVPEVGRRFKGEIWLQGRLHFGDRVQGELA